MLTQLKLWFVLFMYNYIYICLCLGFHAIDLETGLVQDLYGPTSLRGSINPHAIITLPRSSGTELLLCYDSEWLLWLRNDSKKLLIEQFKLYDLFKAAPWINSYSEMFKYPWNCPCKCPWQGMIYKMVLCHENKITSWGKTSSVCFGSDFQIWVLQCIRNAGIRPISNINECSIYGASTHPIIGASCVVCNYCLWNLGCGWILVIL